jgi:hypothetical protein
MVRYVGGYDPRAGHVLNASLIKLQGEDMGKLADKLGSTLEELENIPTMKGGKLSLTKRTIQDHLSTAMGLLK